MNVQPLVKGHYWIYFSWSFLGSFVGLFFLSFSFGYHVIPDLSRLFSPFFEGFAEFTGTQLLSWDNYTREISSDSRSFYANFINIVFLSLCLAALASRFIKPKLPLEKLKYYVSRIVAYYVALQLISYGFNKVFKWQFFMAEPNTLYTPMGQLNKDILYWSVMGASYTYVVFAGVLEVLAGTLLLFRKTRFTGALLAFGIMLNVLMINIGFNISVKLYAFILTSLSLSLMLTRLRDFMAFSRGKSVPGVEEWQPTVESKPWLMPLSRFIIILFIFIEGLWPYASSGNYNDDTTARPAYHGAYEVETFNIDGQELSSDINQPFRWKRFFVHRRGYFITQSMRDDMTDYQLEVDPDKQIFQLEDYDGEIFQFKYQQTDSSMTLQGNIHGKQLEIKAKQLNWRQLPLVKPEFHWTVDEINP